MRRIGLFSCILFFFGIPASFSQSKGIRQINWDTPTHSRFLYQQNDSFSASLNLLHFKDAVYEDQDSPLPYYYELLSSFNYYPDAGIVLENLHFQTLPPHILSHFPKLDTLSSIIHINYFTGFLRKQPVLGFSFIPLRKNPRTGDIERLVKYSYKIVNQSCIKESREKFYINKYPSNSVLSSGKWVKIKILKDGIYKLTYSDLLDIGLPDPSNPRIFGNGGEMLPIMNNVPRPDDLIENTIWIEKGSDNIFNEGDYILFYGKGPVSWTYNETEQFFIHSVHLYSEASYYFITSDAGEGKTLLYEEPANGNISHIVNTFDDFIFHENQVENLLKSGRQWFEPLSTLTGNSFAFSLPNIVTSLPVKIKGRVLARSAVSSLVNFSANNQPLQTLTLPPVNIGSNTSDYALANSITNTFYTGTDDVNILIQFENNGYSTAKCWLDYIILNAKRKLIMEGGQMHFRNLESAGEGNISLFKLSGADPSTKIWDITDIHNIRQPETFEFEGDLAIKVDTDSLRQFIAFDGSSYLIPEIIDESIENQNLHGLEHRDMIIVTHPDFIDQANQLAEYHINSDHLAIEVVTTEQIYNEFSSGSPDVVSIRDFIKMIYDRGTQENLIKYLLLFGDGSFDNFSQHANNTNYILTYQSDNSLRPTQSFVTDDFFGLLDDMEGGSSGLIDIGIGRLPVTTEEEAQNMVDKIIRYNSYEAMGDWRNIICFIGDDEDNNIHMTDANTLATFIDTTYPSFNVQKVFLDAYPQVSSSRGESYPEVTTTINNRINSGALIINYTGHGNELGLAHEQILGIDDISSWKNKSRFPLFITATCEFSRFDDLDKETSGEIERKTSAGEKVILNPVGGGIALLTTTRLVYSSPNFILNQNFFKYVFRKDSQQKPYKLGDILRLTKNISGSGINKRNFTLLGDPALTLTYPLYNIITDSINGHNIESTDTLKALSQVTIAGHIENLYNEILDTFSGIVYPMIFDKSSIVNTLGNDEAPVMQFEVRDNILYKGKATVTNGEFFFSFIVPKDISYNIDYGKISYYANNSVFDANGVYKEILIGGFNTDIISDNDGPEIDLYMNDKNFVSGGITNENPKILAFVRDKNGINTVGNGIGHDITAVLDEDSRNLIVLNNYYESDLNSYQSGKIEYKLSGLTEGKHNLVLKIWDILNNSSEASIEFIVTKSTGFIINKLYNYPNPFTYNTSFVFEHNQADSELNIILQIFTLSGKLIKIIEQQIYSDGFRSIPITWDGRDDSGNKIDTGIYLYRLQVRSPNGQLVERNQKLVVLR
jgi:hypothetical protein